MKPSLLLIALLVGGCVVGVGQTKQDSIHALNRQMLEEMRRLQKIVALKAASQRAADSLIFLNPTWHYQWGTIDHEGKVEFSNSFWLAFAAKWREYEAEPESIAYYWDPTPWEKMDACKNISPRPADEWRCWIPEHRRISYMILMPTFPGFIHWLERKK